MARFASEVAAHGKHPVFNPRGVMANALVRDLDDAVYQRLKARAAGNHRSLEAELRAILTAASMQVDITIIRAEAEAMRRRLDGRRHGDSGAILSEERQR